MLSKGTISIFYDEVDDEATKDEIDVLNEVHGVSTALKQLGFTVYKYPFPGDLTDTIRILNETRPLCIFNLVETYAENGKLSYLAPSLFEALNVKYTGNPAEAIFLTTDKITTKKLLRSCGIPTPAWITESDENGFAKGDRYIVKPVYEDGSIDLFQNSIVTAESVPQIREVLGGMKEKTGKEFFAEKYIEGREINVSVMGDHGKPSVLPPTEIKFHGYKEKHIAEIYSYLSKWEEDSFEFQNTTSSCVFEDKDKALLRKLKDISVKCWQEFGLRGYARVDFRIDAEENPWVLEINANPCISPTGSSFIKSAAQGGLDYTEVVNRIISEVK